MPSSSVTPRPPVVLPCWSISTTSTFPPTAVMALASPSVEAVLPTPPFWLPSAILRGCIADLSSRALTRAGRALRVDHALHAICALLAVCAVHAVRGSHADCASHAI